MIDNAVARDVGAVFEAPGFQSSAAFLMMHKASPVCMPLALSGIQSIQICVEDIDCDFFKSGDCGADTGDKAVFTVGCGDVREVPSQLVANYQSYKCQLAAGHIINAAVTVRIPTTPHVSDPSDDLRVRPRMQNTPSFAFE
ncbi:hypothetical protein GMOD_00009828 [Pyrenophora seminiperda CCB06]|uniref:Uncharacterized protein n=1 Tax=Pyrenophora seminiperda CCB06 TaxID=1302712 RepID=A0A3M7MEK1_9PLEO|nr:hypothetical protein GMOD_00009828 [Pyrenophora seminiperda CCB06]